MRREAKTIALLRALACLAAFALVGFGIPPGANAFLECGLTKPAYAMAYHAPLLDSEVPG